MYYIRNVFYNSDFGFIQNENLSQEYFKYSETKESISLKSKSDLVDLKDVLPNIQINMDPTKDVYNRKFMKIQTLLVILAVL